MDNIFICAICGTECKRLRGLAIHLKHHNIDAETYYNTYIDTSDHTCPYCSSKRKFKNFSYITTCGSRKCYQKAMEATCLSKYGVTNNLKRNISSRILKRKETCLIKYGVDNPTKSATIKEKISKNNKSNTLEVKNKISNTLLNKTDSDKNAAELKKRSTCMKKYGVNNVLLYDEFKHKIRNTMKEKYGVEWAGQSTDIARRRGKKKYFYDDLKFDSADELKLYKFCVENGITIEYLPKNFNYVDSFGINHKYLPDFRIRGEYYEIKGDHLWKEGRLYTPYRNKLTEDEIMKNEAKDIAKTKCMIDNNVRVILSSKLDEFIGELKCFTA